MRYVGYGIGALLLILGLTWVFQGNDFFMLKYFGPKYAATQREIYTESPSYVLGMNQELEDYQLEYAKADSSHKTAIASIVLRRAATIKPSNLNPGVRAFVAQLKSDQGVGN